ncbi:hypothetical protein [Cutibacterium sp.]|uniref:hypothetical protein n=1 Tax=Cutibacterium sp. TaxID=1912221 RepID=UPI0026DCBFA4|nr:hypothetical protein [Cutibacterium sp.]MDO4411481.1 hypothetical protein [Cutibacterium sp.]
MADTLSEDGDNLSGEAAVFASLSSAEAESARVAAGGALGLKRAEATLRRILVRIR